MMDRESAESVEKGLNQSNHEYDVDCLIGGKSSIQHITREKVSSTWC